MCEVCPGLDPQCIIPPHLKLPSPQKKEERRKMQFSPRMYSLIGSKNTSSGAGRVAEVVECLLSKCEVLSSNPNTTKINPNQTKTPA
jgi:hypothetical protein